ncbi:tRNA uridine-5-carboxymethylaminomethyl(34) synthesis enzyme MnmG [candidate division KSB1 bacterium]|nr:tRNA uridine-5-carboxymethylaminomethyl(34) synthesis enzyme MnmG [candidate division KSB1 bacterium]
MHKKYDVIVVGAGHAGCEAALAASRMGMKTILLTMDINTVAKMSCNPAIGGLAKGHLVREIDALGGEMGRAIDDTGIQFKMLNRSKGPAVWSPRAQADRLYYSLRMLEAMQNQRNLDLKQTMVVGILTQQERVTGVRLFTGSEIYGDAVILTAGTFLNGLIHIGMFSFPAGRSGEFAAIGLTGDLNRKGFVSGRLKTGTPPRVDGRTLDYEKLEPQYGEDDPQPFSFRTKRIDNARVPCYLTYTNTNTHDIIRSSLDRSPLYTGKIVGVGPRYCPSIEVKIVRFPDKSEHQLYLEPEGLNTTEYYVNGFATSIPEDAQLDAIHSIAGMEKAEIMRPGYAIEYDFFPPSQLKATMETKRIANLYFAGQINGTSGYEEAAAQGIMAGINAVLKLSNEDPFVLDRSQAYIGVLIDDLITKEIEEPYRMFTSCAEYRLYLRQDNADLRLMDDGAKYGLIDGATYSKLKQKRELIDRYKQDLINMRPDIDVVNAVIDRLSSSPITEKESVYKLLKRPEITISSFFDMIDHPLFVNMAADEKLMREVRDQVELDVKYEGYLKRQLMQIEKFKTMEHEIIPSDVDYDAFPLSTEAREKFKKIKPHSIGQASRIAGISPADISVLLISLKRS